MHRRTLETLLCPVCRYSFRWLGEADCLERGFLLCQECHVGVPVLHGFPLFHEQHLGEPRDPEAALARLDREHFGEPHEYERFLRQKRRRPAIDLYAAFQPFNESSRSLYAFLPMLREILAPGDVILDLWCRTGWTGEILTGLFPEQHVVSIWEGSTDVLGYRGYRAWFDESRRRDRWDVVFHHPGQPLPFEDGSVSFVHGLDTLHRYPHRPLIPDCLRVCRPDGAILFPHVHLTNNEPEPFFERGETQLHGTDYRRYFDRVLENTGRKAMVISEKDLFEKPEEIRLRDDSSTEHYNACVAIVPSAQEGRRLAATRTATQVAPSRVVLNPLLDIDVSALRVDIDPTRMSDGASDLLSRHPMYHERLRRHLPMTLSHEDSRILYWAHRHRDVAWIADHTGHSVEVVAGRLQALQESEIVQLAPISESMARLQSYYADQRVERCAGEDHLAWLWRTSVAIHGDRPFLRWVEDDSEFTYADVDSIVQGVRRCFASQGLTPGDRILVHAVAHPEFHFAFWGAVLQGLTIVVVDPDLPAERWQGILETARPRLALLRHPAPSPVPGCPVLVLACEDEDVTEPTFFDAVQDLEGEVEDPPLHADMPAVVLFTSGSTGEPKGVVLSHGNLLRSAERMDHSHRWEAEDRYLATGAPQTMSGLRNSCITPLWSGASVVLTPAAGTDGPLHTLTRCLEQGVTLLNTTPPFLGYCVQLGDKTRAFDGHRLRLVLCTGSALPPGLQRKFEERFGCPVLNYYGLTETSGACLVVMEEQHGRADAGVGVPIGCAARILAEDGTPVTDDAVGELTIESDSLLLGYLTADGRRPADQVRDGVLYTGDLARRTVSGCVELLGRKDRLLVDRNGENFHPQTIERLLDGREDVVASRVIPLQRENQPQTFAALAVPSVAASGDDAWCQELERWLRARLPPVQVPVILPLPEIPVGPAGKWDPQESQRHARSLMKDAAWT